MLFCCQMVSEAQTVPEAQTLRSARGNLNGLTPVEGTTINRRQVISQYSSLWVFSDEVTTEEKRQTLVGRSAANGIDAIYVSVFRSAFNSAGRRMFEDADVAALIQLAHSQDIEVWAAYGNVDWHTLGCDNDSFPMQRMNEVVEFNQANPETRFDGVMLDCEPDGDQAVFMPLLLELYECIFQNLHAHDLKTGAAIRFFWDEPVISLSNLSLKPGYQHLLDMDIQQVVVMGYRDFAGNGNDNGINQLDRDEVCYASDIGKARTVLVGLETGNCAPECGPEQVTFYEEGLSTMKQAAIEVADFFAQEPGFGGFSIHRYNAAFLSETGNWRSEPIALQRR